MKKNSEVFARCFHKNINFCIENSIFLFDLKVVDVSPVFKKKSKNSKDNNRPINILPNISKRYERCLYNQMQTYFDNLLSKYHRDQSLIRLFSTPFRVTYFTSSKGSQ